MLPIKNSKGKLKNTPDINVRTQQVPPVIMPSSENNEQLNAFSGLLQFGDFPNELSNPFVENVSMDINSQTDTTNAQNLIMNTERVPLVSAVSDNVSMTNYSSQSNQVTQNNFPRNNTHPNVSQNVMINSNYSSTPSFPCNVAIEANNPMQQLHLRNFAFNPYIPQCQMRNIPHPLIVRQENCNVHSDSSSFSNPRNNMLENNYSNGSSATLPQNIQSNDVLQKQNQCYQNNYSISQNNAYNIPLQSHAINSPNIPRKYLHLSSPQLSPEYNQMNSFIHLPTSHCNMDNKNSYLNIPILRNTSDTNVPSDQIHPNQFSRPHEGQENCILNPNDYSNANYYGVSFNTSNQNIPRKNMPNNHSFNNFTNTNPNNFVPTSFVPQQFPNQNHFPKNPAIRNDMPLNFNEGQLNPHNGQVRYSEYPQVVILQQNHPHPSNATLQNHINGQTQYGNYLNFNNFTPKNYALNQNHMNSTPNIPQSQQNMQFVENCLINMPAQGQPQIFNEVPRCENPLSNPNAPIQNTYLAHNSFNNNINSNLTSQSYLPIGSSDQNVQESNVFTKHMQQANAFNAGNESHRNNCFEQNSGNILYPTNQYIQNNNYETNFDQQYAQNNNVALAYNYPRGIAPLYDSTRIQNKPQCYSNYNNENLKKQSLHQPSVNNSQIGSFDNPIVKQPNSISQNQAPNDSSVRNINNNNVHGPPIDGGYHSTEVNVNNTVSSNENTIQTISQPFNNVNGSPIDGGYHSTEVNVNNTVSSNENTIQTISQPQCNNDTFTNNSVPTREHEEDNMCELTQLIINPLKLSDNTLFEVFYKYRGNIWQVKAAIELYNRSWRFHLKSKRWMRRSPYHTNTEYKLIGIKTEGYFQMFEPAWNVITVYDVVNEDQFQKFQDILECERSLVRRQYSM